MINIKNWIIFLLFFGLSLSCDCDTVPEVNCDSIGTPLYDGEVAAIINASCANAVGCHGSGTDNGDFTSFQNFINEDDIDVFVAVISTKGDMPPLYGDENDIITPPLTELEL